MLNGPPCPSTSRLRLLPALPRSVGLGPIRSPPNVPCPWPRLPPAIPSPRRPTLRTVPPRLPYSAQDTQFHPPLKGAMDCAVVPQFFRQSVPLAPAAQAENDAVEHLPGVSPLAASDFRRVCLQDDRPNFPKLVRRFPYGFQAFLQMFLEKPYESPHKPLKAFVRYDFEIVSKCPSRRLSRSVCSALHRLPQRQGGYRCPVRRDGPTARGRYPCCGRRK